MAQQATVAPAEPLPPASYPQDSATLAYLIDIVKQTYTLWDEVWVGFSWRNYTHDHVRRVRNLAMRLAEEEGAGTRELDLGATLHDITKSYDGEIVMKDGKRVLDENGFWMNAYLPPARENKVTGMYETLGLRGQLHNVSGANLAAALLDERGYPKDTREHVHEIIVSHLKVGEESSIQGRCLYDADTIDANIGLPALYRNIQISMHNMEKQYIARGASLDEYLAASLSEYLTPYVRERLPVWIAGKRKDFVDRMTTQSGRRRAEERLERLEAEVGAMGEELDTLEAALQAGRLGPTVEFMKRRSNPSLAAEVAAMIQRWPAQGGTPATQFLAALNQETAGGA